MKILEKCANYKITHFENSCKLRTLSKKIYDNKESGVYKTIKITNCG